ncbi:beta strand repeat-containing protein [Alsobacter metallidurans]|uniref:beta strand repeat-containing protein n=1 Tax=Alsobacter metallidurans TaxID=340221 RepID=UPI00166D3331|nr:hypothetical protein [Alsobacter metallidurans]
MSRKYLLVTTSLAASLLATAAMADNNTVYLNQTADSQSATISQSGNGNAVGANGQAFGQGGGSGNTLTVNQTNTGNSIGVATSGYQSGNNNLANAYQDGVGSRIEIKQSGSNNGQHGTTTGWDWTNSSDYARLAQDSSANGSVIELTQNGNGNAFDVGQGGASNGVSVTQTGTLGQTFVRQNVGQAGFHNSSVVVNQDTSNSINYVNVNAQIGNNLLINIAQSGGLQGAGVDQYGTGSSFVSNQSGLGNLIGYTGPNLLLGTDHVVTQYGDGNQIFNYQSGNYNVANGGQNGNSLFLSNTQGGSGNSLQFNQTYSNNRAYNAQYGTNGSVSVTQTGGDGNMFNSVQHGNALGASVTAYQNGTINQIMTTQYDGANTALLSQTGYNNSITGTQNNSAFGLANVANVTQSNSNNVANYNQNGSGNLATITQH